MIPATEGRHLWTPSLEAIDPSRALYLALDGRHTTDDLSGHNRVGTGQGGVTIGGAVGPGGQSAAATLLDGVNDYISTAHAPFVNGKPLTVMGWAKRASSGGNDTLFGSSGANPVVLRLAAGSTDVHFRSNNGTAGSTLAAKWPGNDIWTHWALVFREAVDSAILYIGGVSAGDFAEADPYGAAPGNILFGAYGAGTDPFDGAMANVEVLPFALTPSEVKARARGMMRPVVLNYRIDAAGVPVYPRVKVRDAPGGLGDPTDAADPAVGRFGEVSRRSQRRGRTRTFGGWVEAATLASFEEYAADLRMAFQEQDTEGRIDASWHPLNTAFAGRSPIFYRARALGLEIGDPILSQSRYRGEFVLAVRDHDSRYFDADESQASVTITNTNTYYDFA